MTKKFQYLACKGGWQHSREQLERHWQQQLHERHDDEDREGDQPEEIRHGAHQLSVLSPAQGLAVQHLPDDLGGHLDVKEEQLEARVVVLALVNKSK